MTGSRQRPSPMSFDIFSLSMRSHPSIRYALQASDSRLRCRLRISSGLYGIEDVAGGQIGGVQVEDVNREFPSEHHEARSFGPCAIGRKENSGPMSNGGLRAKFAAPLTNGAHVPEAPNPARTPPRQRTLGRAPSADLVFEVANDDGAEVRSREGLLVADQPQQSWMICTVLIMRLDEGLARSTRQATARGQLRLGERLLIPRLESTM